MPIYEYTCNKCGCDFEELVFDINEHPVCPQCGSTDTGKLMSVCCRRKRDGAGDGDFSMPSSGGGCAGCSGGNCASCGH